MVCECKNVIHTQKLDLFSFRWFHDATFTGGAARGLGDSEPDSQKDRWSSLALLCFLPVMEARAIILRCCCRNVDATETVSSERITLCAICCTLGFESALFSCVRHKNVVFVPPFEKCLLTRLSSE
jgi:hypothetical protein